MKIWLRLFALIFAIVLVFLVIGSLLPRNYQLAATIEIAAPPADVFPLINELPKWQAWSNFSEERIESLTVTYGAKTSGIDASQSWRDVRGQGKLWITDSVPTELVEYKLNFGEFPTMDSKIELTENNTGGTNVSWSSTGQLPGGAFYGYTGFLFSTQMNYEYEQSLLRLKELAETKN